MGCQIGKIVCENKVHHRFLKFDRTAQRHLNGDKCDVNKIENIIDLEDADPRMHLNPAYTIKIHLKHHEKLYRGYWAARINPDGGK